MVKIEYKQRVRIRVSRVRRWWEIGCAVICVAAAVSTVLTQGAVQWSSFGFMMAFSFLGYSLNRWREYEGRELF